MKPTVMTFHQKLIQLLATAQMLEISFEVRADGATFCYDGDKETFSEQGVAKDHWHLVDTYEPWFFGIAREKIAQQKALNAALVRLRETFTAEERALLAEHVSEGGVL